MSGSDGTRIVSAANMTRIAHRAVNVRMLLHDCGTGTIFCSYCVPYTRWHRNNTLFSSVSMPARGIDLEKNSLIIPFTSMAEALNCCHCIVTPLSYTVQPPSHLRVTSR